MIGCVIMTNVIIISILVIFIALGLKETVKHFKGEGACCGGGSVKVKKKKLKNRVKHKYVLKINGMHCKHCENAVTEIINDFDGVAGRVNLSEGEAIVLCDREIDIEAIKEKIRGRGYEVK